MNKVILIGRLGGDPELRYTRDQVAMARFSLATSERIRTAEGEKEVRTDWHDIVIWGEQAEIAHKYLKKGRRVAVEGKIEYRDVKSKTGQKIRHMDIKVDRFEML